MKPTARTLGVLALIGLVAAFSLSSTLAKRAETPGVLVAFWRMIAVSVLWNAILWCTARRVRSADLRQVWIPGVFFGLNLAVFFTGVTHNSIANAALIGSLAPLLIVPVGAWLFREYISPRAIVFALIAFGGVALVLLNAPPGGDVGLFRDPRFSAAGATVMVLFFALFGFLFLFLATQYLQFVLGFSPPAAGVRILPYAGAMIVSAALSAKLVGRSGTRRVATLGMLLFAAGLAVAATVAVDTGYGRLALAFALMGTGMGLAGAPATESIMSSLPPARANIGSAVNDTTRELGGALGVAVVGSIMASLYTSGLPADTPAAQEAFVEAMSTASLVVALVALAGALIAWRHLPAPAPDGYLRPGPEQAGERA